MKKASLLLAASFAFLCYCNKHAATIQPPITVDRQMAKIELNKCIDLTGSAVPLQICFDSVKDNRCPLTMMCVWEGEATATLSLQSGVHRHSFKLSTLNGPPYFRQDTTIAGAHIKLISLTPYPGDGSQSPYLVELSINP